MRRGVCVQASTRIVAAVARSKRLQSQKIQPQAEQRNDGGRSLAPALQLFYDGSCPLCVKEIAHCRKWDAARGALEFQDISDPAFDPVAETGRTAAELARVMHARVLRQQTEEFVTGVEVFRRMYYHLGLDPAYSPPRPYLAPAALGVVFSLTYLPVLKQAADGAYAVWARFRIWNRNRKAVKDCASGSCRL
ncbi:hypothetical protein DIPPA_10293 [Diplonema papillatum]|nr:hypothetical protein DIPPA_10293 [Diplonema papillatum]